MYKKIAILILSFLSAFTANAATIFAHQGEFFKAPPNTAESVKLAFDLGAKYVEFDLNMTKSGDMICVHWDTELRNFWGIDKKVEDVTLDDLKNSKPTKRNPGADKYPNAKIPTLDKIFAVVPSDGFLIVDIKRTDANFAKKFDEILTSSPVKRSQIILSTRNVKLLEEFKKISPEYNKFNYSIYLSKPAGENVSPEEVLKAIKGAGYQSICIGQAGDKDYMEKLSKEYFEKFRAAGYKVGSWTSDDPERIKKLIEEYRADIIYTNKPSDMRKLLNLP